MKIHIFVKSGKIHMETPEGQRVRVESAGWVLDDGRLVMDVLAPERDVNEDSIHVLSGVSMFNGRPFNEIIWKNERAQMSPALLRQHGAQCFEAAEAAENDALVFAFLTRKMGVSEDVVAKMIGDLRQFRDEFSGPEPPAPEEPAAP